MEMNNNRMFHPLLSVFKIDLIVWKYDTIDWGTENDEFKIDLIVWKSAWNTNPWMEEERLK